MTSLELSVPLPEGRGKPHYGSSITTPEPSRCRVSTQVERSDSHS